ncbi:hypothetical protein TEQG_03833 [Trichophyton equinum CBS 127.97]|uniref:Uncharacterized protein n=1 Tax=Trichophyton equinum (strain ATCC MYA-4606 / CBS 127.97) TaxID=559882 RepID=F2PSX1_TRIEC|nr:hypothetical protein TEQG_03833 [Trichophyton equinum CBS 127.97]
MVLTIPERQATSLSEEFAWEAPGPRAKRTELGPPYLCGVLGRYTVSEEGAGGTWIYKVWRGPPHPSSFFAVRTLEPTLHRYKHCLITKDSCPGKERREYVLFRDAFQEGWHKSRV